MWSLVPIPPGVLELGTLAVHKVDVMDALATLTPEEQAIIKEKKLIEDIVMPKCEAATGHALVAEAKVTPILVEVAGICGIQLHGLDFRVKSGLSMTRKVVSKLYDKKKTHRDLDSMEAEIWIEQRQALRYTLVCHNDTYMEDVRMAFRGLNSAGFMEEFVWNYWKDSEPYNVIRSRLWSEDLQAWCFLVFHTRASLELSEARLQEYQRSIGMVFHTATFQDSTKLDKAVEDLKADEKWAARVRGLPIPPAAETIGKLILSDDSRGFSLLAKPSASSQQRDTVAAVSPMLKTVLGLQVAQLIANAAAAEDGGLLQLGVDYYAEAVEMLKALIDDEGSSEKKKNMAAGELFECETKAKVLKKQLSIKDNQVDGGGSAIATLTMGSTSALASSVSGAGRFVGGGVAGSVVGAGRLGASLAKGSGKLMVGGTVGVGRVLRHNVLSDSLGASTRRCALQLNSPQNLMISTG